MAESDLLEYALLAFEASDFGATFTTTNAQPLPCSFGTLGHNNRLTAGGFSPNDEATIVVRKTVTGIQFRTGQSITVTDSAGSVRTLKIASEGIRDCIYAWELTLDSINQRA